MNSRQLDPLERQIVDLLRADGRMPYREMARRLDVGESTVRKRVARLLESGWMRIQAISDPLALGAPFVATTYAKVNPRHLEAVAEQLATRPEVRYLGTGLGHANLVVESLHGSASELYNFIETNLGLEGIISSERMQVTKIKKSVWNWEVRQQGAKGDDTSPTLTEWEVGT